MPSSKLSIAMHSIRLYPVPDTMLKQLSFQSMVLVCDPSGMFSKFR